MSFSIPKAVWIVAGIALVGAVLYWAFRPQPVAVDLATVETGPLQVTVSDDGKTRIREVYTVSAPVAGTVQRTPGRVGDQVKANQTIVAMIRPVAPELLDARAKREAEAALAAAEAAVRLAEAQYSEAQTELELASSELDRAEELSRREVSPEVSLEQAQSSARSAEARLASAAATMEMRRQERESAQAALIGPEMEEGMGSDDCCIAITAPVDGEILVIHHESEAVVEAGTPLVEIGDPADLEVVAEFLSSDAVRIPAEAPASIEAWGGPPLEARVREVEPTGFTEVSALGIEEQRVHTVLDLLASPEERQRLGHNYQVLVRVTVEQYDDALLVPLGALFRQGSEWAVFVVNADGKAELRTVETGARDTRQAIVLSGLSEGERVILHPSDRIAAGTAIEER
jgi:HlyD family secretion protein